MLYQLSYSGVPDQVYAAGRPFKEIAHVLGGL
jgi:hypothetical protein